MRTSSPVDFAALQKITVAYEQYMAYRFAALSGRMMIPWYLHSLLVFTHVQKSGTKAMLCIITIYGRQK